MRSQSPPPANSRPVGYALLQCFGLLVKGFVWVLLLCAVVRICFINPYDDGSSCDFDRIMTVQSGPCQRDSAGCVTSQNYPYDYEYGEHCEVSSTCPLRIVVKHFHTESTWDNVTVNGKDYSGFVDGPDGVVTSAFSWKSDSDTKGYTYSGWKFCFELPLFSTGLSSALVSFGLLLVFVAACLLLYFDEVMSVPLKRDVAASVVDVLGDVLWAATGQFLNQYILVAAWCLTGCVASSITVIAHYGKHMPRHALKHAVKPWHRLCEYGLHQYFERAGTDPEKALFNAVVCLVIVVWALLSPVIFLMVCVLDLFIGIVLHTTRLFVSPHVCSWYCRWMESGEQNKQMDLQLPPSDLELRSSQQEQMDLELASLEEKKQMDLELWHKTVVSELAFETIPTLLLNLGGHHFQLAQLSWPARFQALSAIWMCLRSCYRYLWIPFYLGKPWLEIIQMEAKGNNPAYKPLHVGSAKGLAVGIAETAHDALQA